jgi:hypothetical protein
LEEEAVGPIYWPESSTEIGGIDSEKLGMFFPVAFKFSDMRTAHVCMFFWATPAILWSGMACTYKVLLRFQAVNLIRANTLLDKATAQLNIAQPPALGY